MLSQISKSKIKSKLNNIYKFSYSKKDLNLYFNEIKNIIQIFNKKNYPIKTIGYRHGEKKDEFLMTDEELHKTTENKNFFSIKSDNRNLNYSLYFNKGKRVKENIKSYSSNNVKLLNTKELVKELRSIKIIKNKI